MKLWKPVILMILALLSCAREADKQEAGKSPVDIEGLPITISFSLDGSPTDIPRTKADEESGLDSDANGGLETLHLAVFGGSGYLKEYVEAEQQRCTTKTYTVTKKVQKRDSNGDPMYLPNGDPDLEEKEFERTVPVYEYKATLAMSTSPRTIHFLGNGPATLPFGWDSDVIPVQLSQLRKYTQEGGEDQQNLKSKAYWQMVSFPDGITAKKRNGYYYSKNGYRYGVEDEQTDFMEDGGFQITDEVNDLFKNIPLIRNWAKVVVYSLPEEDSNFEAVSFAVVNVPSRGSLAPYNSTTGKFVENYELMGFDELRSIGYPASLPENTQMDLTIPDASEFEKYLDPNAVFSDGDRVAPASSLEDLYSAELEDVPAVYLYERPAPSENIPPSFVIIYGKYYEGEEPNRTCTPYYYKVDLMETVTDINGDKESRYYPIYRNFKYQIHVSKILSRGHLTPSAAAASAGSADVSADISTGHLSDISDGEGRLHINWMAKTYTEATEETTLSVFYSDPDGDAIMSQENVPDNPNEPETLPTKYVKIELLPPADKKKLSNGDWDDVVDRNPETFKLMPPSTNETDGTRGWRQVQFHVKEYTGRVARSQSIRITGVHPGGKIYRDVVVSVLPKQPLWVKCGESRVLPKKGRPLTVTFGIPDGLLKSMFPLEFTIESDRMTLTTDNTSSDNMPVVYGESISLDDGFAGKTAFHFLRTITWDEYKSLPTKDQDERIWRTVTCHFKTNCENNAAKVWVYNKYFIHDEFSCDSFENFDYKMFHDLAFLEPIPRKDNQLITFHFDLDENGKDSQGRSTYPKVILTTRGVMPPSEGSPLEREGEEAGTYSFTPKYSPISLTFYTTNDDGEISIDLSADDYSPEHLEPYRFNKDAPLYSYGLLEGIKVGNNYSNVAFQRVESGRQYENKLKDRGVIFGYYDDPEAPGFAPVRLYDMDGNPIGSNKGSNSSGLIAVSPSTFVDNYWTPTTSYPVSRYHEIVLKTPTSSGESLTPIAFRMESPGYISEEFRYPRMKKTRLHTHEISLGSKRAWIHAGAPDGSGGYIQSETDPVWTLVPGEKADESYFNMVIKPLRDDDGNLAPDPIINSNGLYLGGATGTGTCPGGKYEITFRSGNVYVPSGFNANNIYKAQRFYYCQFTIETFNKPEDVSPTQGTYYQYPGDLKKYQWVAFDDTSEYGGPADGTPGWVDYSPTIHERSIVFTAGTSHPIRITSIFYKALSELQ